MNILSEEGPSATCLTFLGLWAKCSGKPGLLEGAPEEDLVPGKCRAASSEQGSPAGHTFRKLAIPPSLC